MDFKKVANANHEDAGAHTTRSFSRHGLSKRARKAKRLVNRAAKRSVAREALKEEQQR